MKTAKTKIIKDFDKLSDDILEKIKLVFPNGFRRHLVEFTGIDGMKRKGLPLETEDKIYLIRMTVKEAINVIEIDEDYDDKGRLKPKVMAELSDKHDDDFLDEFNSNDDNNLGDEDNFDSIINEDELGEI